MKEASGRKPCSLMMRGGIVIPAPDDADSLIEDGAVCTRGDRIVAVGRFGQLLREFAPEVICGSDRHLVIPGLVNAHDHVRAPSTRQLGVHDDVLEAWIVDLLRLPRVDPRLASTLACCRMLRSGVTTVVNSFYEGFGERYESVLADTVASCERSGIRTLMSLSILDRSVVAELLGNALPHLPEPMRTWVRKFLDARDPIAKSDYFDIVRKWHATARSKRTRFMMGPVSVHWCSDGLLQAIWEQARALDIPIQTHLLESPYQRDGAAAKYGRSIVQYMSEAGLLSPRVSCAHCVHVTEPDIELLAGAGVSVVHCASSNQRLKNGTAPVGRMLKSGVNVGLGLDSLAMDDDMLQEMRNVARVSAGDQRCLIQVPAGMTLQMATVNGAAALGMLDEIGTLEVGKKADIVALRLSGDTIIGGGSGIDTGSGLVDRPGAALLGLIVDSAEKSDVDAVIVDGEIIVEHGQHRHIDEQALLDEIHAELERKGRHAAKDDAMIAGLKPFVHGLLEESNTGECGAGRAARTSQGSPATKRIFSPHSVD